MVHDRFIICSWCQEDERERGIFGLTFVEGDGTDRFCHRRSGFPCFCSSVIFIKITFDARLTEGASFTVGQIDFYISGCIVHRVKGDTIYRFTVLASVNPYLVQMKSSYSRGWGYGT